MDFYEWIKMKGLKMSYIAGKLGINRIRLYSYLYGHTKIPIDVAYGIIELTRSEVKLIDLIQAHASGQLRKEKSSQSKQE